MNQWLYISHTYYFEQELISIRTTSAADNEWETILASWNIYIYTTSIIIKYTFLYGNMWHHPHDFN